MAPSRQSVERLLPLRPVVFQVLLSLLDAEMHGYALVQDIARRTAAGIELEPGNLYRHLKFMLDAGLIVGCQKIEHYEIAGYGSAVSFAKLLGDSESARLLAQTLNEEERADKLLTQIAESAINVEAAQGA